MFDLNFNPTNKNRGCNLLFDFGCNDHDKYINDSNANTSNKTSNIKFTNEGINNEMPESNSKLL